MECPYWLHGIISQITPQTSLVVKPITCTCVIVSGAFSVVQNITQHRLSKRKQDGRAKSKDLPAAGVITPPANNTARWSVIMPGEKYSCIVHSTRLLHCSNINTV